MQAYKCKCLANAFTSAILSYILMWVSAYSTFQAKNVRAAYKSYFKCDYDFCSARLIKHICPLVIYSKKNVIFVWHCHYLALVASLHKLLCLGLPNVKSLNPPIRTFLLNGYTFCPVTFNIPHWKTITYFGILGVNFRIFSGLAFERRFLLYPFS